MRRTAVECEDEEELEGGLLDVRNAGTREALQHSVEAVRLAEGCRPSQNNTTVLCQCRTLDVDRGAAEGAEDAQYEVGALAVLAVGVGRQQRTELRRAVGTLHGKASAVVLRERIDDGEHVVDHVALHHLEQAAHNALVVVAV